MTDWDRAADDLQAIHAEVARLREQLAHAAADVARLTRASTKQLEQLAEVTAFLEKVSLILGERGISPDRIDMTAAMCWAAAQTLRGKA